ncbi:MAG: divergent polysaccharide deacetylase family protein [Devosia sp.]
MAGDLDTPLKPRSRRNRPDFRIGMQRFPWGRLMLAASGVIVLGVAARILLVEDPQGGRPQASAPVSVETGTNPMQQALSGPVTITADPETPVDPLVRDTADIVVTELGQAPGAQIDERGIYSDLVEETALGPLPRVSAGRRPFDAYRRPASATGEGGRPRVALLVTGLGLNERGTLDAISALPDEVSLGFAPYGRTLSTTVAAARAEGHELFLEVPMEPFDYPNNDPGPDTLLTGQTPRQSIDKLYTVMASFGGYAGIVNNMGARFTASAADLGPVMEEVGTRGLGYIDDGASNRTVAPQLASTNGVPFVRASRTVDSDPSRAAIVAALSALEADAQAGGAALGVFSALPVSVAAVSEWAAGLSARGFELVPASALMK